MNSQFVARQSHVSPSPICSGARWVCTPWCPGWCFVWLGKQRYTLDLEVQNALNTAYRDYTSMLRYYADEPGMQAFLRLGAELDI